MQVDQVEETSEPSRKDGGQDEVSRVVCCLLFLAQCWMRKREKESEREGDGVFTLNYYYHPGCRSEGG